MPKVYLRPIDKFEARLKHNFDMAKGGSTFEDIGRIIGRVKSTARQRAKDPLDMTLGEMFLLCQHEHIEPAEFVGSDLRLRGGE